MRYESLSFSEIAEKKQDNYNEVREKIFWKKFKLTTGRVAFLLLEHQTLVIFKRWKSPSERFLWRYFAFHLQ